jgi:hypothetical protein
MIERIAGMSTRDPNEVFAIGTDDAAEMQLIGLRERFDTLRPQLRALGSLAEDVGVTRIERLEDVVPLCFPHTMYKAYSPKDIELGRYERLSLWLDALTTEDVAGVDVSGCDSLESWLDTLEATTSLYPSVSSGTTGKISFFPRTSLEADTYVQFMIQAMDGFGDELASRIETGEPDWFAPIPMASGRQMFTRLFDLLRRHCYGGDAARLHTLGRGHWDADMLWLSGRIRAAEARGETASSELTPALERVRDRVKLVQEQAHADIDRFLEELVVEFRDRRIVLFAPTGAMIELARLCRERGFEPRLGEGSFIITGGGSGSKGVAFPDGWEELLHGVFPPPYQELYGMTECTGVWRLCPEGWFHGPPTVISFVVDPDTGVPLERSGVQTGRHVLFDLSASTHWGGAITGDQVTIDWDGGCPCGRTGPRILNNVTRYSLVRGDDKITCAMSPGAYERAVDSLLASGV